MSGLFHGGDLHGASKIYGRPAHDWLDLSTGINISSYPAPTIPTSVWQQLPYLQPELIAAAQQYYGPHPCLASSGSQPIIELLPQILRKLGNQNTAWLADVGYQEHRHGWAQLGSVKTYNGLCLSSATEEIDAAFAAGTIGHLVVINPNNPTGQTFAPTQLQIWTKKLHQVNGYLVVDEAFIDTTPKQSMLAQDLPNNVVVLRSVGKFFGLAGIRLGFTFASEQVLIELQQHIGPWSVNGPAQHVATEAFKDTDWHQIMRKKLTQEAPLQMDIWQSTLQALGARVIAQHELFRSFSMPKALAHTLLESAAHHGILLRLVEINPSASLLRFGNIDLTQDSALQRCNTWLDSVRLAHTQ